MFMSPVILGSLLYMGIDLAVVLVITVVLASVDLSLPSLSSLATELAVPVAALAMSVPYLLPLLLLLPPQKCPS